MKTILCLAALATLSACASSTRVAQLPRPEMGKPCQPFIRTYPVADSQGYRMVTVSDPAPIGCTSTRSN